MSLDARPPTQDARPNVVEASDRACCGSRAASRPMAADEEITVVRLAGDRETSRALPTYDDDVTVLRTACRGRKTS